MHYHGVPEKQALAAAKKLYLDPLLYVVEVLGGKPTHQQKAVLQYVGKREKENFALLVAERAEGVLAAKEKREPRPTEARKVVRIAIRSGHGTGKSTLMAWLMHWFINTRPDSLIPCTAPKSDQLSDVLWGEFTRWHTKASPPYNRTLDITADEIRHFEGIRTWKAVARTARKDNPEALQGFHAKHLLLVCEEASGIEEKVFEVGEGTLSTPGAIVVLVGNPTRVSGTFYRAFHEDKADWATFHFDWEELAGKYPHVDPEYGPRMARKYGGDSNIYRVRVRGDFPTGDPDALIPLSQVEDAVGRNVVPLGDEPVVYGVDVARFGDDETVFLQRCGLKVDWVKAWRGRDTMQTAALVQVDVKDGSRVFVDSIGVGGGVADRLRQLGVDCEDVNVSERPSAKDEYTSLRDELWWSVRKAFEGRQISIPDDEELIGQLSTIKYRVTPGGKIKVESKADRKKRLGGESGGSPDRADALMLTFAASVYGAVSMVGKQHKPKIQPVYSGSLAWMN